MPKIMRHGPGTTGMGKSGIMGIMGDRHGTFISLGQTTVGGWLVRELSAGRQRADWTVVLFVLRKHGLSLPRFHHE